jgi:hypothetical protein
MTIGSMTIQTRTGKPTLLVSALLSLFRLLLLVDDDDDDAQYDNSIIIKLP